MAKFAFDANGDFFNFSWEHMIFLNTTIFKLLVGILNRSKEIVPKWQRGQMSKHHRVLPVLYSM